ncbi:MAG: protein kinase family protein [Simkaniaceae bacterium]|nr:protein kinase family protein [Simkaniaceae bacterium]
MLTATYIDATVTYLHSQSIPIDESILSDIFKEAHEEGLYILSRPLPEHDIELLYDIDSDNETIDIILREPASADTPIDPDKGYTRHPCIGSGGYKRIFNSVAFRVNATGDIQPLNCVVAKIKSDRYRHKGIEHLFDLEEGSSELPPTLLSIPYSLGVSKEGEGKSVYLVMDRLQNPNLSYILTKPVEEILNPLFQGAAKTARACQFLHQHGLIHRDVTLNNMTIDGLFDYDTLCTKGIHRLHTGPRNMRPPEISGEARHADFNEAFDVYMLGYQFARVFKGELDSRKWEMDPGTQRFFQKVLHKDPAERPSMEEFATFLESKKYYPG